MENQEKRKIIVNNFLSKNILLSIDTKEGLTEMEDALTKCFESCSNPELLYLSKDLLNLTADSKLHEINWFEFEKARVDLEKKSNHKSYNTFLDYIKSSFQKHQETSSVKIITSFKELPSQREVRDFTIHFNSRLDSMQKILYSRDELKGVTSISRILAKRDRDHVALIGLVASKRTTKNGNLLLSLEDSTGSINVLINKNKPDIFDSANDIVLDEAIGVIGVNGENIVFANNVIWPDIPMTNELKKTDDEAYSLFLSDLHVGSNNFLTHDFDRFLNWLNLKNGNEKQKEIASKVKYIFIIGDLVDGVGIYPGQENDLTITDVRKQYEVCASLLSKIPPHIQIIICGGNHDSVRIAEPQPALTNDFCKVLSSLPNVTLVSNPATVNIHSSENFSGFNILLYHGYSFDYYVANVDSIRNNGGYDRADLIMKFLLKRRHLAPTHTSTLYVPAIGKDPLIIDPIPDFFVTGHIHKSAVSSYKNITLICGSCWQSKTDFQEKVGHHPEPSRVPLVNLSTREVKILKFGK